MSSWLIPFIIHPECLTQETCKQFIAIHSKSVDLLCKWGRRVNFDLLAQRLTYVDKTTECRFSFSVTQEFSNSTLFGFSLFENGSTEGQLLCSETGLPFTPPFPSHLHLCSVILSAGRTRGPAGRREHGQQLCALRRAHPSPFIPRELDVH